RDGALPRRAAPSLGSGRHLAPRPLLRSAPRRTPRSHFMRSRGFTIVEGLVVLGLLTVIVAISLPNLVSSRKHRNERDAIGALKSIATSEAVFREGDKEVDGNLDYGMLSELGNTR